MGTGSRWALCLCQCVGVFVDLGLWEALKGVCVGEWVSG